MIIGLVGTPGSGKTYDAVKKIVDNLRLGRIVYTNIDGLNAPECREAIKTYAGLDDFEIAKLLFFLDDQKIREFWLHVQKGSMIVIDEVHKLFSNRDWQSEKNRLFTEWASTHRHEGFDVVLVTQDIEKIDKHARSLIEWTYFYKKINFVGSLIQNRYCRYAYSGDDHHGAPMTKGRFNYDKNVFACYQSYAAKDIKELGVMKNINIFNHPIFYGMGAMVAIFLYFFSQSSFITGDLFGTKAMAETKSEAISKPDQKGVAKADGNDVKNNLANDNPKVDKSSSLQVDRKKEVLEIDPIDVVKAYSVNGKIIYTNNNFIPDGGKYIKVVKSNGKPGIFMGAQGTEGNGKKDEQKSIKTDVAST